MKHLTLLLALGPLLSAQGADEILRRSLDANKANAVRSSQYTYVQEDTYVEYDKSGRAKKTTRETYDVVFVEGEEYKRLVARNGQPLNAKEQAKEEKKMQEAARERRKKHRGNSLFHREFYIGTADNELLMSHFEHRVTGVEEINGRKAWVVESTPRPDKKPANDHERDVLSTQWTRWIDQTDGVTSKSRILVTGDKRLLKPGSTLAMESMKLNDDVWVGTSFTFDYTMNDHERLDSKFNNYRKFDVQSTITVDPPQ